MIDLVARKEEYDNLKNQKAERKKKIEDDRTNLANLIALFGPKEAVIYKDTKNQNILVIIKDCENCIRENIGIISNFILSLKLRSVKRSTADMRSLGKDEIGQILEFIGSADVKISDVRSLDSLGTDYRWTADAYGIYF